jgi:hypothetical protein
MVNPFILASPTRFLSNDVRERKRRGALLCARCIADLLVAPLPFLHQLHPLLVKEPLIISAWSWLTSSE